VDIVLRSSVIFLFLWLLTRALGRRELTQLNAFELVVIIVMGDMVQQAVTQQDTSVVGGVLAVGTMGLWVLLFSWVAFRFRPARRVLDGRPVIVVRDGEPVMEALRVERITFDDLLAEARQEGIDDLRKVRFGVLEVDGKFSFLQEPSSGSG
jgi:uncharacterized membrane protein YcaP (DUF421 family)